MRKTLLILTVLLAAVGCEAPTAPGDKDNLAAARARWREQGGEAYNYELTRNCFCVFGGRQMTVTVRQGAVAAAEYLDTDGAVEPALLTYIPTVPDLFDLIEGALQDRASYFFASYDPTHGYPTRIEIDYSASAVDDELAISARGLVITAPFAR